MAFSHGWIALLVRVFHNLSVFYLPAYSHRRGFTTILGSITTSQLYRLSGECPLLSDPFILAQLLSLGSSTSSHSPTEPLSAR